MRGQPSSIVQEPTTVWHGPEGKEGTAEGWTAAPKGIAKHPPDLCYLPQKWLHTWGSDGSGHKKGVNAIRWFPRTAHLLASAGLDGRVKLWDVHGGRKCRRTYDGHSLGVRAVTFNDDGSRFISTAYDKKMLLWDTETGQVRGSIVRNRSQRSQRRRAHGCGPVFCGGSSMCGSEQSAVRLMFVGQDPTPRSTGCSRLAQIVQEALYGNHNMHVERLPLILSSSGRAWLLGADACCWPSTEDASIHPSRCTCAASGEPTHTDGMMPAFDSVVTAPHVPSAHTGRAPLPHDVAGCGDSGVVCAGVHPAGHALDAAAHPRKRE